MNDKSKSFGSNKFLLALFSILISFVVGAVFLLILGISPVLAYGKLITGSLGSVKAISNSVIYATPLIVVGLSVAFSFRTGVFNIGAEGQFVVGAMAACVVGILVPAPSIILIPLCFLAAAIAGAVWGIIVGYLKVKFGINEVLSMIMFNWIAFYLSNYIADIPAIHSTGTAEATENVAQQALIILPKAWTSALGLASSTNWGILIAIALVIVIYVIIERTTLGFELKAVGFNRSSAEYAGINVNRSILTALAISGALAGIGGALQLLGLGKRISIFTGQEGFGFQGIIVALIGSSSPIGCLVAGLFYGALKYGGSKLNLISCPGEVIDIITGTIVFFIAISSIFRFRILKGDRHNG